MQVSKIITRYGVLKNPSAIETKMVLTNPINAKAFIEKPFQTFCEKVSQDKSLRDKLRFIHKGQALPLDEFIKITDSEELARVEKAKNIMAEVRKFSQAKAEPPLNIANTNNANYQRKTAEFSEHSK